jgi:hypothetical protein
MSQPQKRIPAHNKTVFYTEGQTTAVLVERLGGRRRQQLLGVTTAEALLTWCRANAAALLYLPTPDPEANRN